MSVWVVYRCDRFLPDSKKIVSFPESSLIEWFQNNWIPPAPEKREVNHHSLFPGLPPFGLDEFLFAILAEELPPPSNLREMRDALQYWPVTDQLLIDEHAIQILSSDQANSHAIYIFDHHFLLAHPDRVAWLIYQHWQLPPGYSRSFDPPVKTRSLPTRGRWTGCLFGVTLGLAMPAEVPPAFRIERVRLPQLANYLIENQNSITDYPSSEFNNLKNSLVNLQLSNNPIEATFQEMLLSKPTEDIHWQIYGDWLEDRGRKRAEFDLLEAAFASLASTSLQTSVMENGRRQSNDWHVEDHVAQMRFFRINVSDPEIQTTINLFLFDDLWAGAHPDLATNLLRLATRWDLLSDPEIPPGTLFA